MQDNSQHLMGQVETIQLALSIPLGEVLGHVYVFGVSRYRWA